MAYGIQLDNIPKVLSPEKTPTEIGSERLCVNSSRFSLLRYDSLLKNNKYLLFNNDAYLFLFCGKLDCIIKRGERFFRSSLEKENSIKIHKGDKVNLNEFYKESVIYFFSTSNLENFNLFDLIEKVEIEAETINSIDPNKNFDFREKYWGSIESIFSDEKISGKIMRANKGITGSLEYHLNKYESYYIAEGILTVGLRVGRAENTSVIMKKNNSFSMFPGLMHCRIPIEDVLIIEISTKDEDSDSYIVEDGQNYIHIEQS